MSLKIFATTCRVKGGPSAYPVPRNSTSNWAIATCLTRVFYFHPQPKHTHWSVWRSNFNHCSNQNTWSNIDFLFVSVLLWAPRLLYIVWVWNSHLVHHQCSITNLNTGPGYSTVSCHRKFRFFYLEDCLEGSLHIHLMEASWTERTGTLSTRELPTGDWKHRAHSIKKTKNTHPKKKKKKRHQEVFFFFFLRVVLETDSRFLWMKKKIFLPYSNKNHQFNLMLHDLR